MSAAQVRAAYRTALAASLLAAPTTLAARTARRPSTGLVIVPERGHAGAVTDERFAAAVSAFLESPAGQ